MQRSPYGSWPSPIGAAQVARAGVRLSEPAWGEDGAAWWLERRPQNEGRTTLVREGEDVTPPSIDVRTKVHEYGGGAWLLGGQTAYFSNFADQRLYRLDPGGEPVRAEPLGLAGVLGVAVSNLEGAAALQLELEDRTVAQGAIRNGD